MTPINLNLKGILRALARGSVHSHSPLPRPSSGERLDAAFSRNRYATERPMSLGRPLT